MNPDLQRVRRFFEDPSTPVAMDTNPLIVALRGVLWRAEPERLEMRFEPGPEFLQGAGVIQGGIVATILDFAMGFLVMGTIPAARTTATAQLDVSYFRPARAGPLVANASTESRGRTIVYTRADLLDGSGKKIASATAVNAVFPLHG